MIQNCTCPHPIIHTRDAIMTIFYTSPLIFRESVKSFCEKSIKFFAQIK